MKDPKLKDQALRTAKSACLNIAEAASRVSAADKARVFGIGRGEAGETAAAVEIAAITHDTAEHWMSRVTLGQKFDSYFRWLTTLLRDHVQPRVTTQHRI
ncbi:MAG: four helix bundle protein [Myxococcales bacterium]|nr:four helix bundle protein [Myxococcales bacterium]